MKAITGTIGMSGCSCPLSHSFDLFVLIWPAKGRMWPTGRRSADLVVEGDDPSPVKPCSGSRAAEQTPRSCSVAQRPEVWTASSGRPPTQGRALHPCHVLLLVLGCVRLGSTSRPRHLLFFSPCLFLTLLTPSQRSSPLEGLPDHPLPIFFIPLACLVFFILSAPDIITFIRGGVNPLLPLPDPL